MKTIKTIARTYIFDDGRVEDLIVRGVNAGIYERKYEGKYTIFYNIETGANIARRSKK